jgi:heat shock protein HslJ
MLVAGCGSSDGGSEPAATTKALGTKGTGSSTTTSAAESADIELDGTEWRAVGMEGYQPVPDTDLVLHFEDGRLSIGAGCNTMSAPYELDGSTLRWTEAAATTMMACSPELEAQDATVQALFTDGGEVALADGSLTFTAGETTIRLEEVPDVELAGTEWTLDGTIADDAIASLPAGVDAPTLTIADDGTAAIFAGCNRGSTQVEITDDTLTLGPVALTRMACEEAAMDLEHQVVQVLDGEVTYAIDGDTLTVRKDGIGLTFTAG